ncbi:MAG: pseudouridine synthase [Waddliaceae bacterium]|nr:pseudouridine synthase [Waddliaceae bacterium]
MKIRLSKALAQAGVASRRASEELIFEGKVEVNGEKILLPQTMVDPIEDNIVVNGKKASPESKKVYYILNKPKGLLCSNVPGENSKNQRLVVDLFPGKERVFTVGRLDRDTTGLIVVTNDGHFGHKVIHPSSNIHKEYLVKVDKFVNLDHLRLIEQGVWIDGAHVQPIRVRKMRRGTLRIIISEGKNREVRRLMAKAGLKVRELTRIRIGGLHLGSLPVGHYRQLGNNEREAIFQ